ncbi:hypothetical protein N7532_011329 [Penicillium argentinense]|uniref:Metallo-dependent hydrolase n=1 Tax=Penicillium argentinense TaxID=1131581 RepID=A0A9W9EIF9_9EURO|nr:uncharacterized protein N7532_011329 [Penicillium argentinense]KAJ5082286.1 hypothetical protein N7532_011329 [Penicillium argentinense]
MPPPNLSEKLASIRGVRLANSSSTWDISFDYPPDSPHGIIKSITPHDTHSSSQRTSQPALALPSLTHPHIHLDKAFIHNEPRNAHRLPLTGSFQEALSLTAAAKQDFTLPDLLRRGEWLLAESVSAGVTAMRAFVEVDHTVGLKCVEAAVTLKKQWHNACEMQIVCFAQDPIFSTDYGDENTRLMEQALEKYPQIDVIGTTPYVETSLEAAKKNIDWAVDRALQLDKHLDFHLDYHLDTEKEALMWYVLNTLIQRGWNTHSTRNQVMLGHCTRMTLFTSSEWQKLAQLIHTHDVPVSFVGLPTSDLYMASPPHQPDTQHLARGTLQIPELIRRYGLDGVLGMNNLGNAFTPWGSADPLQLACLGVGVYQAGTRTDTELLYECVSTRARAAIGLAELEQSLMLWEGQEANLVLFCDRDETGCGVSRPRGSVAETVWDPPGRLARDVVFCGRLGISGLAGPRDAMYRFLP